MSAEERYLKYYLMFLAWGMSAYCADVVAKLYAYGINICCGG